MIELAMAVVHRPEQLIPPPWVAAIFPEIVEFMMIGEEGEEDMIEIPPPSPGKGKVIQFMVIAVLIKVGEESIHRIPPPL